MNSDESKTSELPAVGASGAIGILPDGYFAKILTEPAPQSPPSPPVFEPAPVQSPRHTLADRG